MIKNNRFLKITIFIVLFSLISIFSVSCSSIFDSSSTFTPYDLRGSWRNIDNHSEKFTISYDGILVFYNADGTSSRHYIENWNRDKYSEKSYYDLVIPNLPILGNITFHFISDTECEITYGSKPSIVYYYEKY